MQDKNGHGGVLAVAQQVTDSEVVTAEVWVPSLAQELLRVVEMAKTFKKHDIGTSLNLSNFSFTLKQISCEFYFFLFFWPPPGIWNSQARDKIPATPMTYTAAVATPDP